MQSIMYLNGQLVFEKQAVISPLDHGFLYGHGLFETIRVYNGKPFRLPAHLNRLKHGVAVLNWPKLPVSDNIEKAVNDVLSANGLKDASVRLTLSRGEGAPRPDASTCGAITVMVLARSIVPFDEQYFEQGWNLITVKVRRNQFSPLCSIKSANYLDNLLAKAEALERGAREGLMLNTSGEVAEGTMSNIFLVYGEKLITPNVMSGILPGITRNAVLELAGKTGMLVEERFVEQKEVYSADEVFVTSSIIEVMPVTAVDEYKVSNGHPGQVTRMFAEEYRKLVLMETHSYGKV